MQQVHNYIILTRVEIISTANANYITTKKDTSTEITKWFIDIEGLKNIFHLQFSGVCMTKKCFKGTPLHYNRIHPHPSPSMDAQF